VIPEKQMASCQEETEHLQQNVMKVESAHQKTLDVNSYATKKSIEYGLLDVSLITANACQLKYVLFVGHQYEFYTTMLWLTSISIVVQGFEALLKAILTFRFNIKKSEDLSEANV
jgi:hypothetical protein